MCIRDSYGAVPIVRQTGGLNDTVRSCQVGQPDGNGYVFAAYDAGAMLDTIGQAVGLYHGDAEGFRMVRRRGMEGDFSWDRSAGAYRNIYGKLLEMCIRDRHLGDHGAAGPSGAVL